MLPLFVPWALLPWEVAWFVWRGGDPAAACWSDPLGVRPPAAADGDPAVLVLAFPIGANLDTGNINLLLALALLGAQFTRPRLAGLIWGLATWMKWVPAPVLARPAAARPGVGPGLACARRAAVAC